MAPKKNKDDTKDVQNKGPTDNVSETSILSADAIQKLMTEFKKITSKFDTMEKKMENKLDEMNTSMKTMQGSIDDIAKLKSRIDSVEDISKHANFQAEQNTTSIKALEVRIKSLETKLEESTAQAQKTSNLLSAKNKELSQLQKDHAHLDSYMRRDNLIFLNVPETADEDCEVVLKNIFSEMGVADHNDIKFTRCHRLNSNNADSPRPIICRFHFYGDRIKVWDKRSGLKGKDVIIREDFNAAIMKSRRVLLPILKEARAQKLNAGLSGDKLYINNVQYTTETLCKLPDSLQPILTGCKKSETVTAFFTQKSPFSNFFPVEFQENGIQFHSVEQYFQYHKARLFDHATATKIMSASNPATCKGLGKKIPNFDKEAWHAIAKDTMKNGLKLKFSSNVACKNALLDTGDTTLAEASLDTYWGTGIKLTHENATDPKKWTGKNILGELLQEIRIELG